MSFQLKGLKEKRGKIKNRIEAIGATLQRENRAMSDAERTEFDQLKVQWQQVQSEIATFSDGNGDGTQANSARIPGLEDRGYVPRRREDEEYHQRQISTAFAGWARAQWGVSPTRSQRAACKSIGVNPKQRTFSFRMRSGIQKRSLAVGATSGGGGIVARDFMTALEVAMQSQSNVRGVCREITTDTGADLDWPTWDDTGNTGEQIGEGEEVSFEDPGVGAVVFKAFKTSSKGCLVNAELLNDSAFDLDVVIGEALGTRIGKFQGPKFTTGSGTGEPQGIVTASTLGLVTASATAIAPAELTRLIFSIDSSYRNSLSFGLMMHDSIISYLFSLKDDNGRPIYRPTFIDGTAQLVIDGYKVYPNMFMDAADGTTGLPVATKKHVLAGDMSKFVIRDAGPVRVRRLDERYAEKDQVGFVGFARSDSRLVKSGAIKYLQQHS